MIQSIWVYFFDRLRLSNRKHPIYILPTLDGLKLLCLNVVLLIIGLIYANNYVLLFNFILFCLFLASMFYTHFNLQGVVFESIESESYFANENGSFLIKLRSKKEQDHFFVKCQIRDENILSVGDNVVSKIAHEEMRPFHYQMRPLKRGELMIDHLYIETTFPLNFFKCFTLFKLHHHVLCYPEKIDHGLSLISHGPDPKAQDAEDFILKKYQHGDPLNRVNWKRVAKNNDWQTKHQILTGLSNFYICLDVENKTQDEIEKILSQACFDIYNFFRQQISFGIKVNGETIREINSGDKHMHYCLSFLARFASPYD